MHSMRFDIMAVANAPSHCSFVTCRLLVYIKTAWRAEYHVEWLGLQAWLARPSLAQLSYSSFEKSRRVLMDIEVEDRSPARA